MTDYKFYQFDGTTTYTDQSAYVFDGDKIPVFQVNSDMKPIIAGMNIRTKADYSSGWLADGELIAVEQGSTKIFYGYVESSFYDWKTKTYNYNILHLFEQMKGKTCYTDLAANVHSTTFNGRSAYDNLSNIKSGTSDIDWNDLTAKELIEHILEHSDYTGVTQTVTWSVSGDLDTIITNFCASSLCIKYLGTDFDDDELTAVTVDPEFSVWDILSELLKTFGLRFYWTGDKTITVYGSPTAISSTDYSNADTNNYKERVRKLSEQKRFVLKQNILNIEDQETENDIHRYFTPLIYGIPYYKNSNDIQQSGDNLLFGTYGDHGIPQNDATMFKEFYMNINNNTYNLEYSEDLLYHGTSQFTIISQALPQYMQVNVGDSYDVTSVLVDLNSTGSVAVLSYAEITTATDHDLETSQYDIFIGFEGRIKTHFQGTYTYNSSDAGIGYPSTSGTYNIDTTTNTIKITRSLQYTAPWNGTITDDGVVTEDQGSAGNQYYIDTVTKNQSKTFDTTVTQAVTVIKTGNSSHFIDTSTPDTVYISGISDTVDGKYLYKNRAGGSGSGVALADNEYWYDVGDTAADEFYIKYQTDHINVVSATLKPIFPKYENYAKITSDGKEDKNIKLADYLVFYKPSYSTASDWKEDWFTVDMSETTNTTLLQAGTYSPWWLYTFSQDYQTYKNELLTLEDSPSGTAISYQTARKISFNVEDNSAEIEQDKT